MTNPAFFAKLYFVLGKIIPAWKRDIKVPNWLSWVYKVSKLHSNTPEIFHRHCLCTNKREKEFVCYTGGSGEVKDSGNKIICFRNIYKIEMETTNHSAKWNKLM